MVLSFSRYLYGRFVSSQNLAVVVRGHLGAFSELGRVPKQGPYNRMKTAVLGEDEQGSVIYHPTLLDVASHYGFVPRACAPYRAKTKCKIEPSVGSVGNSFDHVLAETVIDLYKPEVI